MWIAAFLCFVMRPAHGLAVDGDHAFRHIAERCDPGGEAPLELLGVEHGHDISKMTVCRRAILEGTETARKVALLLTEQRDIDEGLGTGQYGEQAKQQSLLQQINDLAALTRIGKVVGIARKTTVSSRPVQLSAVLSIVVLPTANRGDA